MDHEESRADGDVSVVIPARNEAVTVAAVVAGAVALMEAGVIDEVVVVDDHSHDDTAAVAAGAGARVIDARSWRPEIGPGGGKGVAMWKGLAATTGALVVFCDADLRTPVGPYITGLLGPLRTDESVALVKGRYRRPLTDGSGKGGRVTELLARPLLTALVPTLAAVSQPLGGETAARRSLLESLAFDPGYGVDVGLLLDTAALLGPEAIAQVDLPDRLHRNRPLDELRPMAEAVLRAVLRRTGVDHVDADRLDLPPVRESR